MISPLTPINLSRTSIKQTAAQNEALDVEVNQLEVQVLDITQGRPTELVLEEMRMQIAEADMVTKVAESQGAAMTEVGKEKEELVRRNTAHKDELQQLNEENKDTDVQLPAGKETLNRVKEQVVEILQKHKREEVE